MRLLFFMMILCGFTNCKYDSIETVTPSVISKPSVKSMFYKKWRVDTITYQFQSDAITDSIWDIQYLSPPKVYIQQKGYNVNPLLYGRLHDIQLNNDSLSFKIWFFIGYNAAGPIWYYPTYFIDFLSEDSMAISSTQQGLKFEFTSME